MTWSYDPNLSTDRDWVRFKIGDTDSADQLLTNEELDAAVSLSGNRYKAAIQASLAIGGKFARSSDKWVGDLRIFASQRAKHYLETLPKQLKVELAKTVAPYAGGISLSDKRTQRQDTDQNLSHIRQGMTDYPGVTHGSHTNALDEELS